MKVWLWLIKKTKCLKELCIILFFKLLSICLGITFALWMRRIIDHALIQDHTFLLNSLVFIIILLSQIFVGAVIYNLEHRLEIDIDKKLKSLMMKSLMKQDYHYISSYHSGELMNRYSSDLSLLAAGISRQLPNMITMVIRIIAVMIVIGFISPLLSFVLVIGGLIMIVCAMIIKRILTPMTRRVQSQDDKLKSHVQECIESLLVIHSFHVEDSLYEMNINKLDELVQLKMKKMKMMNIFEATLSFAVQGAYVTGFLWVVYGVMHGTMSVGSISAIISLVGQIKNPFVGIGLTLPHLLVLTTNIERIKDLVVYQDIHRNHEDFYEQLEEICIENVSFSYNDKPVLNHFNLNIKKGETVAFVGYSGAGKTTILKLLMNIYGYDSGRIYLKLKDNHIDIDKIGYGFMTYVPQDYGLMSGTIKEAVAFGCKDIDMDKVMWACQKACIHNDIIELKDGYDTYLKEQGKSLSGGQMQRIAIARAIYSDCPVMLLDEVTSSLNPKLEQDILKSLQTLENKTIIIVSHRKEVCEISDRIIDFDDVV